MAEPYMKRHLTALSGEFFTAAQLCLRGYVASLTLKNYPDVDIFALNPKNNKTAAIQVKTKKTGKHYYVPEKVDELDMPFVFVYIRDNTPEYYIVPCRDVAEISMKERDDYLKMHPSVKPDQPRMINIESILSYRDKYENLGLE